MTTESPNGTLGAAAALAFVTACTTTGRLGDTDDPALAAAFQNTTTEYSGIFLVPSTGRIETAKSLEVFWSPTCMFSARLYGEKIASLLKDQSVRSTHNIGFMQVSRHVADTQYHALMRSYDRYADLCLDVLDRNSKRKTPLSIPEVLRLASRQGYRRVPDYSLETGARIARVSTNLYRDKVGIRITPTLRLDGKFVTLT